MGKIQMITFLSANPIHHCYSLTHSEKKKLTPRPTTTTIPYHYMLERKEKTIIRFVEKDYNVS